MNILTYVTAVRSCDVVKGHQNGVLPIALHRKERIVSLCSAHQDASNDIDVDLEVTLRSCDLSYTYSYAYELSTRGSQWYCYFCSSSVS